MRAKEPPLGRALTLLSQLTTHMPTRLALVAILFAACGQEKIDVRKGETADYNHGALLVAVDKFVAAGRTPDAYGELAQTVLELRSGMDRSVAKEAELKLMVLALVPVQAVQQKPMADQVDKLALTVWPTLLSPPLEADELNQKRDSKSAELLPKPGEDQRTYILRLCGGVLASNCKQVVPEFQGAVISALATRKATERVRNAVADCVMCSADPGWHEAVRSWEALDRNANTWINDVEHRADPDNWPVAGSAAELDAKLPEAEINATGEIIAGDQKYGAAKRVEALRELRGDSTAIALHMRPEMSLAQVRGLLDDAAKAGASRIAVVARAPQYPWERKVYWLAETGGMKTGLRQSDSLQLLLHAVDAVAGPGTIARVD